MRPIATYHLMSNAPHFNYFLNWKYCARFIQSIDLYLLCTIDSDKVINQPVSDKLIPVIKIRHTITIENLGTIHWEFN